MTRRSPKAIQQAMTRMLYDPAYVQRLYDGPVAGLRESERQLLIAVDRRAWQTDVYRRSRGVHALVEEYPVTTYTVGVSRVEQFFFSDAFAALLRERGCLAEAFGRWIETEAGPVASLERGITRARRREARTGFGIGTRVGTEAIIVPSGSIELYTELRGELGPDPLTALAEGARTHQRGQEGGSEEALLIESSEDGEVSLSGASPALAKLLLFTATPRPLSSVVGFVQELGCDEQESKELIDELLSEGLLFQT